MNVGSIGRFVRCSKYQLKNAYFRYLRNDSQKAAYCRWVAVDGDTTLRYRYGLTERSLVVDAGGYRGDFAAEMHRRYGCSVIVFEPVTEYYRLIGSRFHRTRRIEVIHAGVAGASRVTKMSVSGSSSSLYAPAERPGSVETVKMVSLADFFDGRMTRTIDVLKLNIEGGEYEVLDSLVETSWIKRIHNIQVQFHSFVSQAEERRSLLHQKLGVTHLKTWDFPFVWENWSLRD